MEQLMGCPDGVLLVLIETAALAHWKEFERARGSLSTRELLRRGDTIEEMLHNEIHRADAQVLAASAIHEHTMSSHMHLPRPSGEHNVPPPNAASQLAHGNVVGPATGAAGASGSGMSAMLSANMSGNTGIPGSARASPRSHAASLSAVQASGANPDPFTTIITIFREAASLYLQTVVNELSSPRCSRSRCCSWATSASPTTATSIGSG